MPLIMMRRHTRRPPRAHASLHNRHRSPTSRDTCHPLPIMVPRERVNLFHPPATVYPDADPAYAHVHSHEDYIINDPHNRAVINRLFRTIYVVSLVDCIERHRHIRRELSNVSANYHLVYFHRPKLSQILRYHSDLHHRISEVNPRDTLLFGELGCCLSHSYVLERVASDMQDPDGLSLILEDDICFSMNISSILERLLSERATLQPHDILLLGVACQTSKFTIDGPVDAAGTVPISGRIYGAFAYSLTSKVAGSLLTAVRQCRFPADGYYSQYACRLVQPECILQDRTTSTIGKSHIYPRDAANDNFQPAQLTTTNLYGHICPNPDMAICMVFFAPVNYKKPKLNAQLVIEWYARQGMPIYVAELLYPEQTSCFTRSFLSLITHYIQLRGKSITFCKENLWNILFRAVPKTFTKLLFLDGDVIFQNANWYANISKELETHDVVHPYETVHRYGIFHETTEETSLSILRCPGGHPGFGVACQRQWLTSIGEFFDYAITGSGDGLVWAAADHVNVPNRAAPLPSFKSLFIKWRNGVIANTRAVTYARTNICLHLNHGTWLNRQYVTRHVAMRHITPGDLTRLSSGLLEYRQPNIWNPIMLRYFRGRAEDDEYIQSTGECPLARARMVRSTKTNHRY